jgi:hypothetical protein
MNRADTLKIMAVLQAAYPQFYAKKTKDELDGIVNLWARMFEDEPYGLVEMAVYALIKTRESTYPPGIGEINAKIMQITQPQEMTEMEAWSLVRQAISNGIYGAQKEFDALPPVVQSVVGSPAQLREWATMDSDTVQSVVASNFQRSYKVRAKNHREYLALPSSVKQYMDAIADGMSMDKKLLNAPH